MLEGGCSHCSRFPIDMERATRLLHESRQQAKPKHLSHLCIMDAICFYVSPQMVSLQRMWYSLFVESGELSPLCLPFLQGGCFRGPPSFGSCYTPLLCYYCFLIHNLQRVCWQQQVVSHSCRVGDSNLFWLDLFAVTSFANVFLNFFQASNSLQKPF